MKTELEKELNRLRDDIQKSNKEIDSHKMSLIKDIKKMDKSRMYVKEVKKEKRGLLWRIKRVLGLI